MNKVLEWTVTGAILAFQLGVFYLIGITLQAVAMGFDQILAN